MTVQNLVYPHCQISNTKNFPSLAPMDIVLYDHKPHFVLSIILSEVT